MVVTPSNSNPYKASITAGYKILKDAGLQNTSDWLGCKMAKASSEIQKDLATATAIHAGAFRSRQGTILHLREKKATLTSSWDDRFQRAAAIESEIASFFQKSSKGKDDLEEDALGQLSFQHNLLRPLNSIPFAIAVVAMFKVWVVPVMTIATPLLAWILPYILLKFVYSLPISQTQYMSILRSLWSGHFSTPFPGPNDSLPSLFTPKSIGQFALLAFSFLQSMIQPIQNAMHLHKTDKVFLDIGAKLLELRDITRSFREDLAAAGAGGSTPVKLSFALERLPTQDVRRAFMTVVDQPERLEIVLKDLSRLEIYWRIAQKEGLNVVLFQPHVLAFENAVDISLKSETAVPVSLALSKDHRPHTVLTGPNGGGKSSFMRATLQMVLLGHAYGFAHVKFAIMPRFSWIASGLQLRDTPGVYSMFETEVKFAADCLKKIGQPSFGPGLILYDELFHSTNPPDGTRTAQVFLQSLWSAAAGSVYSVVSTHVFPLVEGAPAAVLPICCPAEETPEGDVKFSYTIEPGICRVSSVKKVWERFGLSQLTAKKAGAAAKSAEPKPLRQKELDAAKDAE